MAAALIAQQRTAESRLESLLLRGVEARLCDFLLASLERWGQPHPAGELIAAPFTHAEIALLIGSTRETVTLLLGKLKRVSLLEFDRRRLVIRDRAALSARAAKL
jgi:CRP-like cAMP-binding protein